MLNVNSYFSSFQVLNVNSYFSSFQVYALIFRFDKSSNGREISANFIALLTTEFTILVPFHFRFG